MQHAPINLLTDCYAAQNKDARPIQSPNKIIGGKICFFKIGCSLAVERMLHENISAESDLAEFRAMLKTIITHWLLMITDFRTFTIDRFI